MLAETLKTNTKTHSNLTSPLQKVFQFDMVKGIVLETAVLTQARTTSQSAELLHSDTRRRSPSQTESVTQMYKSAFNGGGSRAS